jgi:DNA-binding NarL/FixJ family response regulator
VRDSGLTTPPKGTATLPAVSAIRLLVVDDHPALRTGLRDLLDDQPDFTVVGAVEGAKDAMALAAREDIDVAIVDYQLEGRDGLWLSRKLKRLPRPPRVIIYSAHSDPRLAAAAVVAQADALISKGLVGSEMWDAIRGVADGRRLLPAVPPRLGDVIRGRFDHEEQAIFGMLWAGVAPAEIARTLAIPAAGLESRLGAMLSTLARLPATGSTR